MYCIDLHDTFRINGGTLFNATFNNISVISCQLIGGGNRCTRRKPPTSRKSLTNFIKKYWIEYTSPRAGFEFTKLLVIGTHFIGSCRYNGHTITTTTFPGLNGGTILYYYISMHAFISTCIILKTMLFYHVFLSMGNIECWKFYFQINEKRTNQMNHHFLLSVNQFIISTILIRFHSSWNSDIYVDKDND